MKLYAGIDLAVGLSSSSSRTAVVVLPADSDIPVWAELLRPETQDFDKRLAEILDFCISAVGSPEGEVEAILIAQPKQRGVPIHRKDRKTGKVEKIIVNLASMFDLAEVRGATGAGLTRAGYRVLRLVESSVKKDFTGNGRADKQEIHARAKLYWPGIMDDFDLSDGYMFAHDCRKQYSTLKKAIEEAKV